MKHGFYISILILSRFICLSDIGWAQPDSTVDLLPLSVGERWLYGFSRSETFSGVGISYSDTGFALYSIIDSSSSGDSTRWTIILVREYQHASYITWPLYRIIRDSTNFELIEYARGHHELYTPIFNESHVFSFPIAVFDSLKFYRYAPIDSSGQTHQTRRYPVDYFFYSELTVSKDTGITESYGVWASDMYLSHTIRVRNYLKSLNPQDPVILQVEPLDAQPVNYSVYQNYPNPFNPTTEITYSLPQSGLVTLRIFDVLGREVTTLARERKEPGTHTIQWNADGYPSGIYFYRFTAGDYTETRKMVLMK